ncbi:MAG: class I SAM-dependent methyltransferase [Candidatus Diapherotrites archaeon]
MKEFITVAKYIPIYLWFFFKEIFLRVIGRKKEAFKLMIERDSFIPRNTPVELLDLSDKKGKISVFDIGCGDGGLLEEVKKRGCLGVGVELSHLRCKKARKHGKIYEGDFLEQDIKEKFDVVIASGVLEHMPAPNAALQKIKKLMKKDAVLVIMVPNDEAWERRRRANPLEWWKIIAYHGYHMENIDLERAKKLLSDNGFKIVKINNNYFANSDEVSLWDIVAEVKQ